MWVPSLGWEDPPEESMATHYSILAWKIPWTGKSHGQGAWWATVHGVEKSWTRLKQLSMLLWQYNSRDEWLQWKPSDPTKTCGPLQKLSVLMLEKRCKKVKYDIT